MRRAGWDKEHEQSGNNRVRTQAEGETVMATPALSGPAIVGKFYMVPCMKTVGLTGWLPSDGWVPILGPKHEDAEHLKFPHLHYHIDWRFITDAKYRCATFLSSAHSHVLTNTGPDSWNQKLEGVPVLKRRKCQREMPDHPAAPRPAWALLEIAQGEICNKLKPGNICPHRGIDLTPFIKDDGTVICPGHGLKWDTKTGDLLPHHARAG